MTNQAIRHAFWHEIKENLGISVPLIMAQMIYAMSGFLGTAMVARLGEEALAASVLVSIVWASLSMLFFGILNAVSVLVSHQYGAKDNLAISRIMGQAFWIGLIMTILLSLILFALPFVFALSEQPPHVLAIAKSYVYSLIWTVPGLVILVIIEQFLAGINRAKLVLRISLIVVPIEVPLIYMLIFGKFGLPECGVAGIGYGFAITYTFTTILLIWYLLKSRQYQSFQIFGSLREFHSRYFKEFFRIGIPMGFMHVIEISAFAVATFWIAQFGTTYLAAHQIVIQYLSFLITMVFAMSQTVTIRVGHAVGQLDLTAVRFANYVGLGLSSIGMFFIMLGFLFLPEFFISIDLNIHLAANQALLQEAKTLLSICGVLLIFDNLRLIGFGTLRGLKDTRFPMYASFFSFWIIGLTLAYILGFHYQLNVNGIWCGLMIGIICGAILVSLRIHYILKRVDLKSVFIIK